MTWTTDSMPRLAILALLGLLHEVDPAFAQETIVTVQQAFIRAPRARAAAICDPVRHRIVAFGGTESSIAFNDVEILNLGSVPRWNRVQTLGTPPPAAGEYEAAYDAARDRMLVLGGDSGSGAWSLSLGEPMTWTELDPAGTRPSLRFSGIAFDPVRDRVLGFGGQIGDQPATSSTWALALSPNVEWIAIPTAGGSPPNRLRHGALYDSLRDRMIVFGGATWDPGTGSYAGRNDAWQLTLDGTPTWNPILTTGNAPAAREDACVALDPIGDRMVVFGGFDRSRNGSEDAYLDDTWFLPLTGGATAWQVSAGVERPPRREGAIGLYIPGDQRFLVSGGNEYAYSGPAGRSDTWTLPLGPAAGPWRESAIEGGPPPLRAIVWPAGDDRSRDVFVHLGGVGADLAHWELVRDDTLRWRPRSTAGGGPEYYFLGPFLGAFHDPAAARTYTFTLDSLWTLTYGNPDTWTRRAILGPRPGSREETPIAFFDARRERILMLGGITNGHYPVRVPDFWILSLADPPSWINVSDSTPLGVREFSPPIHDSRRDRVLFFGGCQRYHLGSCTPFGDLWALDLASLAWDELAPSGPLPAPRFGHAAAFDSTADRAWIVWGAGADYSDLSDIWSLQFDPGNGDGDWGLHDPAVIPVPLGWQVDAFWNPEREAILVPRVTLMVTIRVGAEVPVVQASCPDTTAWDPGQILPLSFDIEHRVDRPASYLWRVESGRDWPGFPLLGFQDLGGIGAAEIAIGIPVPDSAAFGVNLLRFVVRDSGNPSIADSCAMFLSDPDYDVRPIVNPPGDWIWKPGMLDSIPYQVTNLDGVAHAMTLTLSSGRDWPGFPMARAETFDPGEARTIRFPVVVPDSVAVGANVLTLAASWNDRPEVHGFGDHHLHDEATPARISLVELIIGADGVKLIWFAVLASNAGVRIERREKDGLWEEIGRAAPHPTGRVEFVDRSVRPGLRYAYRAGAITPVGIEWSDPIWADIPGAEASLVVRGPSAGSAGVHVVLTLPDASPATLDLVTIAGRRVLRLDVGPLGSGRHEINLAGALSLAPGIYLVRLSRVGSTVVRRAILLQ